MTKLYHLGTIALFLSALFAAELRAQPRVRYADRTIDLAPFVSADEILRDETLPDAPGVFARVRIGGAIRVRYLQLAVLDDTAALVTREFMGALPDIDQTRRALGPPRRDSLTGDWIFRADTANDEHWDLFVKRAASDSLERLTAGRRVNAWSPRAGRVAVFERAGGREPYGQCLALVTVATRARRPVLCSDSATSFFTDVAWRSDGRAFTLPVSIDTKPHLPLFTLHGDSIVTRTLVPGGWGSRIANVQWLDTSTLQFAGDRDGTRNLYDVDVTTGTVTQRTHFTTMPTIIGTRVVGGRRVVLVRRNEQQRIGLTAYDITTLAEAASVLLPRNTRPIGAIGNHWLLEHRAVERPTEYRLLSLRAHGDSLGYVTRDLPASRAQPPQHCSVEPISYTTHDGREVKGFLRTPRVPLPDPNDRLAIVYAYYGGEEEYDKLASVWCAAGIASLSPHIDRDTDADRGGNEVADVLVGAR
jgi:dipeptidyl aminopeptidase/acylaminoacyl peptidase